MLQAESEKLRQAWIQAVQASIASAYKDITDNYYMEVRRRVHAHPAALVLTALPPPCSVWTGQPRPPPAASTPPASCESGGSAPTGGPGAAGRACSSGCRASQAMNCAATVGRVPHAGLPSTWEYCCASSALGSTGKSPELGFSFNSH